MNTPWIIFALSAYFLMALSQLIDKALLNVAFKEVKSYVFLIATLSSLAFILIPFGVTMIPVTTLLIALLGGALFIGALIPFLSALQGDDASRVIPLIGGLIPLATFLGEYLFLGASFSGRDVFAFFLLVTGAIILTFTKSSSPRRSWSSVIKAIIGSVLFASSFLLTKYIFDQVGFVNGFFWLRMGGVLVGIALIFNRETRTGLKRFFKKTKKGLQGGFFANQILNGTGFVLQAYAISLASVSLVTAMQGAQYIFVIILVVIASRFNSKLLGEKITKTILVEKLTAIVIIVTGIALLSL